MRETAGPDIMVLELPTGGASKHKPGSHRTTQLPGINFGMYPEQLTLAERSMRMTHFTIAWKVSGSALLASLLSAGIASGGWPVPSSDHMARHDKSSQHFQAISVVNQDQFEGNWKQLKGALKEQWGEFTDDDLLAIEGKYDKFEGKLQERYGDRKEDVKAWLDQWLQEHRFDAQSKSGQDQ